METAQELKLREVLDSLIPGLYGVLDSRAKREYGTDYVNLLASEPGKAFKLLVDFLGSLESARLVLDIAARKAHGIPFLPFHVVIKAATSPLEELKVTGRGAVGSRRSEHQASPWRCTSLER